MIATLFFKNNKDNFLRHNISLVLFFVFLLSTNEILAIAPSSQDTLPYSRISAMLAKTKESRPGLSPTTQQALGHSLQAPTPVHTPPPSPLRAQARRAAAPTPITARLTFATAPPSQQPHEVVTFFRLANIPIQESFNPSHLSDSDPFFESLNKITEKTILHWASLMGYIPFMPYNPRDPENADRAQKSLEQMNAFFQIVPPPDSSKQAQLILITKYLDYYLPIVQNLLHISEQKSSPLFGQCVENLLALNPKKTLLRTRRVRPQAMTTATIQDIINLEYPIVINAIKKMEPLNKIIFTSPTVHFVSKSITLSLTPTPPAAYPNPQALSEKGPSALYPGFYCHAYQEFQKTYWTQKLEQMEQSLYSSPKPSRVPLTNPKGRRVAPASHARPSEQSAAKTYLTPSAAEIEEKAGTPASLAEPPQQSPPMPSPPLHLSDRALLLARTLGISIGSAGYEMEWYELIAICQKQYERTLLKKRRFCCFTPLATPHFKSLHESQNFPFHYLTDVQSNLTEDLKKQFPQFFWGETQVLLAKKETHLPMAICNFNHQGQDIILISNFLYTFLQSLTAKDRFIAYQELLAEETYERQNIKRTTSWKHLENQSISYTIDHLTQNDTKKLKEIWQLYLFYQQQHHTPKMAQQATQMRIQMHKKLFDEWYQESTPLFMPPSSTLHKIAQHYHTLSYQA